MKLERIDTSGMPIEKRFEILEDRINVLTELVESVTNKADRLLRDAKEKNNASENQIQ